MNKYLTATQKARKDILAWLKEHERLEIPARIEYLRATYPFNGCDYDQEYHDGLITLLAASQQYPGRVCDLVAYDLLWDLWHDASTNVKKTCGRGHAYAAWNGIAGALAREIDALRARNRQTNGSGYDGSAQTRALILVGVERMAGEDGAPVARVKIWRNWCENATKNLLCDSDLRVPTV